MLVYGVIVIGISLIVSFVTSGIQALNSIATLLASLLALPVGYGLYVSFLNLGRGQELKVDELFAHFNKRVWTTLILQSVYSFLWTLLLIVPGIIKGLSYSMTVFVLADNPELSNNEAIEKSMTMMDGKKMKLFMLLLSFLGWILLTVFLTFGIGMLWVAPYMYQSMAAFYEDLKAEEAA